VIEYHRPVGEYWSSSDFATMCLLDHRRTLALRDAIRKAVRPGDLVLDVGSCTGVLSLFAAQAGAGHVISVESDLRLAGWIRETAQVNGLDKQITVLDGDVSVHDIARVDVVIAELVETALIEETLVPVLNSLRERGTIAAGTRVIPCGYRTRMRLVDVDEEMYGFRFRTLRHEWPFYARGDEWSPVRVRDRSAAVEVWRSTLDGDRVDDVVRREVSFHVAGAQDVNGVRIMGEAETTRGTWIGAFNTLNGDKVYPLPQRRVDGEVSLAVCYRMGAGLRELDITWL
jgi:predicted RNA methylase